MRAMSVSNDDAHQAAVLSQDVQPVHLDPDYAARTRFGRPIVPGAFAISRVAGLLGTGLVDLRTHYIVTHRFAAEFLRPVFVGDELRIQATVTAWGEEDGRLSVDVEVRNQRNRRVLLGTADLVVLALTDHVGSDQAGVRTTRPPSA